MNHKQTQKYAFILGRERELCLAELKAVLNRFCFCFSILSLYDNVALIKIDNSAESDVAGLSQTLGGTIKIFRLKELTDDSSQIKEIVKDLILEKNTNGKMNYGISSYARRFNRNFVNNLGLSIKKEMKKAFSLRFVALREGTELSTIVSLKNKLYSEGIEVGLFHNYIGYLIGLSNAEEWNQRDYGKPAGDKYSGMLPPKLARIMTNLALRSGEGHTLVVDPFCGSGNIALEAILLGYDIFASDISEKAVQDTKKNIEWLLENAAKKLPGKYWAKKLNATSDELTENLKAEIPKYQRVAVVCEPYLGEPKKFLPSMNAVRGEYRKIKDLYLNFFENLKDLYAEGHLPITFCVVFPLIETIEKKRFSLYQDCVDEIKKMGYTTLQSPLNYGRDYQVVKREISLLTLK